MIDLNIFDAVPDFTITRNSTMNTIIKKVFVEENQHMELLANKKIKFSGKESSTPERKKELCGWLRSEKVDLHNCPDIIVLEQNRYYKLKLFVLDFLEKYPNITSEELIYMIATDVINGCNVARDGIGLSLTATEEYAIYNEIPIIPERMFIICALTAKKLTEMN